jgi:hypothetical protein
MGSVGANSWALVDSNRFAAALNYRARSMTVRRMLLILVE